MIVMKFGGSSLANANRIKNLSDIIRKNLSLKPILVCSAMGNTTELLLNSLNDYTKLKNFHISICEELGIEVREISPILEELDKLKISPDFTAKERDLLLSFGERLSVRIISAFLNTQDISSKPYDAWDIGMITNSDHGEAKIRNDSYSKIDQNISSIKDHHIPVITGFIAKNPSGEITTFGRGGSDLSATIIGAAINAKEVQVWKDVDGLMTADPKIVKDAKPIDFISFQEASELAYFGAKILHPLAMKPIKQKNIPVRIKNSYKTEAKGTLVSAKTSYPYGPFKSITLKKDVILVDIISSKMLGTHGFLAKIFNIFDKHNVSVDMLSSSEISISVSLNCEKNLEKVIEELSEYATVDIDKGNTIVSIICEAEKPTVVLRDAFSALNKEKIQVKMISQAASHSNIGLVFNADVAEKALKTIHDSLISLVEK